MSVVVWSVAQQVNQPLQFFSPQKNISSSQFQVRRARTSAAFTLKRFSVINACSNKSGGTFWKRAADVRAGGGEDSRFCSGKDVLFVSV